MGETTLYFNNSLSVSCRLPKSMCNPKDNLVRMIRTIFGIGTEYATLWYRH